MNNGFREGRTMNYVGRVKFLRYALLCAFLYFLSQSIIVLLHEYTHSTAAWLLGYTATPRTVIWGNPLTMRGWDEGVPYDQLFGFRLNAAESVIGGAPLAMHFLFVAVGLACLRRGWLLQRRLAMLAAYWFVVANMAELVAYLWMRPFIPTGDTGRFNAGLGLTPWPLFLVGNLLLLVAFAVLVIKIVPTVDARAEPSVAVHWINVSLTAFFLFLWSSGFRILSLYPDPQWKWGLAGFAGFFGWLVIGRLIDAPVGNGHAHEQGSGANHTI